MPKRSKADTEKTISAINEAVVEQMLELGYDKMSYTTLSEQTGISRTGISHHFPRKTDFTEAIDSKLFDMLTEHLALDNDLDTFKKSWLDALSSSHQFVAILKLFVHHIVVAEGSLNFAKKGLDGLYEMTIDKLGDDAEYAIDWLLGKSIIEMSRE
jgi:AcrR family transcriptional regulator